MNRREKDAFGMGIYEGVDYDLDTSDITNAVCDAACTTARDIKAQAIVALSKYGQTARRMSKFRPAQPIIAPTPVEKRLISYLFRGEFTPCFRVFKRQATSFFCHAIDCAKQIDMVSVGDRVVIIAGIPLDTPGNTNIMKVEIVSNDVK
ncbi:MAG: hypothetical protein L6V93_13390 [Clostridiales bacterium]|nr:MAG: hypothetical protein L6V93_13390 [Clostridiales bacterium]